jgi:regulation of enolase protein 1 (concanavalin A-like superfamily)
MTIDLSNFKWINPPNKFNLTNSSLTIHTDPVTDFWQRTYYNFQHDNAHTFVAAFSEKEFSFTVRTSWKPSKLFDQCGIVMYQDADNWFKASVEFDNESFSRMGSVVTNLGYSDWATTDIDSTLNERWYRLSRRGQDFCIEQSLDGTDFKQMRIFHMHTPLDAVRIGVYACSPLESSMPATFTDFHFGECQWALYVNPDEA